MDVKYDPEADAAYFRRSDAPIIASEEVSPGVIYDYDADERIVGIEIVSVRQRTLEEIRALHCPFNEQERQELKELFASMAVA